jgi:hypothetical protein
MKPLRDWLGSSYREKLAEELTLLICIRVVPCSNFDRDTDDPD